MDNRVTIREAKPGSTVATKPNQGNTDRNGVFFCRPLFLWFVSFGGAKEMNKAEQGSTDDGTAEAQKISLVATLLSARSK